MMRRAFEVKHAMGWLSVAAMLLGGALVAQAAEPEIFLSWRAPYGEPRAVDTLVAACGDTARVDTLYLSFRPNANRDSLTAITSALLFHPAPGDTLEAFWGFERGATNNGNLLIMLHPDKLLDYEQPRAYSGAGQVFFTHENGRARLHMVYFVDRAVSMGVSASQVYCFARVTIRHRRCDLPGYAKPVCIELDSAYVEYSPGNNMTITTGDHRHVTWNAPRGMCAAYGAPAQPPAVPTKAPSASAAGKRRGSGSRKP